MVRKYPKPILCGGDTDFSFYRNNYLFTVSLNEHNIKNNTLNISFTPTLNSQFLWNLLNENKIKAFYKVETKKYSYLSEFNFQENSVCQIDKNTLERVDNIKLTLMLIADTDFFFTNCDELIDEVKNLNFNFRKNELMAISNTEILNYQLSGNAFINISLSKDQENKGLKFASTNKEVIQIKVGSSLNEAYTQLQQKRDAKDILNPFLAFNAILYAIEKAIFDTEKKYKESNWYSILEQAFDSDNYDSLEDFIEEMHEGFDADIIFEEVQKMINNSLELRIRDVARRNK